MTLNNITFIGFLLIGFVTFFSVNSTAEIYKWVDENGKIQFSDQKLKNVQQEVITPKVSSSEWSRYDIIVEVKDVEITDKEHERIVDDVGNVYEFYSRVLFFDIYKTVPVKILVFKDAASYYRYLTEKTGKRPPPSYGMYYPKDNQIFVYIQEEREHTFETIKHEVSHAIVDTITPYTPNWLNEGLAEKMETLTKVDGALHIAKHDSNSMQVKRAIAENNLLSVSSFLKLPSDQWRHTQTSGKNALQAQAGQFVSFLLSSSPNQNFLSRLMHNFKRGDRTISYYLVDKNYTGGIKTLTIKWQNWLKEDNEKALIL